MIMIFLIILYSLIEGKDEQSAGGTRLHDSFVACLSPELSLEDYNILFAHEHFHNWLGRKIRNNEDEELNYWFTEGFTDYYSTLLALRAGVINLDQFVTYVNYKFEKYYLSPVINEPNSKVKQDFWNNYDIEKLPYNRGFMFALYLDNLIKKHNKKHSLDNAILDLYKILKGKEFSNKIFKNTISKYLSLEINIDQIMHGFIDQGKTITIDSLINNLPLEEIKIGRYELGFDKEVLLRDYIIKNIDQNSNAYKAGLREGDEIINWELSCYNPRHMITLKTNKLIAKFYPQSPIKKDVYKFKTNLTPEEKKKIKDYFVIIIDKNNQI